MALTTAHLRSLGYQGIRCSSALKENFEQKRYASNLEITKSTNTVALRRGTGGRSSFNGVVCTLFGNNGFLGTCVANQLGKIGTQLIIPYRGDHYDVINLKLVGDLGQVLFQPFNLKDEKALYKAMKYSNVVINLIGRTNETSNFSFEDVHVTGARNIARIAKDCGVKRLIHVSALGATENPKPLILKKGSGFLASKWRGEQAVREVFPEATIIRPSIMFGDDDNFTNYYGKQWRYGWDAAMLPLYHKGKDIYKYPVFVSDVAKGIVNAIFEDKAIGQIYEFAGPRRYELCEIIRWFFDVMLRDKKQGFKVTDLKYSFLFKLKVSLVQKLYAKTPKLSWERLEYEHCTEELTPGLPSLEDLGVKLTLMEDLLPVYLRHYRMFASYLDDFGEFPTPKPPKIAVEEY